MRYFLESPARKGGRLNPKGQIDSMPIYHCKETNTFWLLMMKMSGKRYLLRYDPDAGTVDSSTAVIVPDDWEGEPQTIGIDYTTWQDMGLPDYAHTRSEISKLIRNGDFVCLVDESNRVTHLITIGEHGQLVPRPLIVR